MFLTDGQLGKCIYDGLMVCLVLQISMTISTSALLTSKFAINE